jgi:hypothetical protein
MTEFTVHLANRPGVLVALAEKIAVAGVDIEALAAFGTGDLGIVHLLVPDSDSETTRSVLDDAGMWFEERPILTTILPPGPAAVAALAHSLAEAGVNIEAMYLLRTRPDGLEFAVAVDQPQEARRKLAS